MKQAQTHASYVCNSIFICDFLLIQYFFVSLHPQKGALAQLARVLDWQSRGHRFDSDMLHLEEQAFRKIFRKACFLQENNNLLAKKQKKIVSLQNIYDTIDIHRKYQGQNPLRR